MRSLRQRDHLHRKRIRHHRYHPPINSSQCRRSHSPTNNSCHNKTKYQWKCHVQIDPFEVLLRNRSSSSHQSSTVMFSLLLRCLIHFAGGGSQFDPQRLQLLQQQQQLLAAQIQQQQQLQVQQQQMSDAMMYRGMQMQQQAQHSSSGTSGLIGVSLRFSKCLVIHSLTSMIAPTDSRPLWT